MSIFSLFEVPKLPTVVAKIISKRSNTLCVVQDNKNRRYLAESDGSYLVGQTVIIKEGVVIGRTKSLLALKGFIV